MSDLGSACSAEKTLTLPRSTGYGAGNLNGAPSEHPIDQSAAQRNSFHVAPRLTTTPAGQQSSCTPETRPHLECNGCGATQHFVGSGGAQRGDMSSIRITVGAWTAAPTL